MAFIVDENLRIQTAVATKMLLQAAEVGCRSVDIDYTYAGDAIAYDLEPAAGFFTWQGAPSVNPVSSEGLRHGQVPKCGDHECGVPCIGPMWFPFNLCDSEAFYNVLNGAANCTMKISEGDDQVKLMGPGAYRYMLPEEYKSWVTIGGNSASICGPSFYYHYSQVEQASVEFTGKAYKKGIVDKFRYAEFSWAMPPFGNTGRAYVERYVVRDFYSFIDNSTPVPKTEFEYMPMVFDAEDLVYDFNCFAYEDKFSPLTEPFFCFSMMNHFNAEFLPEKISTDKYRFEDIIEVIYHGNCMYPPPIIDTPGGGSVRRYGFKEEDIVWAWPEYWKPLERNIDYKEELKFVDLVRPEYYLDSAKKEHRLITDQGAHTIIFEPPTSSENSDGEGDTEGSCFPSISIDGANQRYFQIIYNTYNEEQVDWKDESTSGEVGSSGGDAAGNIYETTNPNSGGSTIWLHNEDTLFDYTASSEISEDRKAFIYIDIFTGEVIYGYYNQGLIAHIYKNRLQYLPVEESSAGEPTDTFEDDDNSTYIAYWEIDEFGLAPTEITIRGTWGISGSGEDEIIYSKPAVAVRESTEDPEIDPTTQLPTEESGDLITSSSYMPGDQNDDVLGTYKITITLPKTPSRLAVTLKYFTLVLTAAAGERLLISSVDAKLSKYVRTEESIQVWERKYYVGYVEDSFPGDAQNADGPNTDLYRGYDRERKNAGQYFPFTEDVFEKVPELESSGKVISKLNMVAFGEIVREDQEIDTTIDNLKYVEEVAQTELYNEAYDLEDFDKIIYNGKMPPAFAEWLRVKGIGIEPPSSLHLEYKKIDWDHHEIKMKLRLEGTFWMPGGHYFKWSDSFFKARCYIFGPVQSVYSVMFVHNKHGGTEGTLDALHAYAGWGRLDYYEGRLASMGFAGYQNSYASTDLLTGAKNSVFEQSKY
jgi:hypothetical protein